VYTVAARDWWLRRFSTAFDSVDPAPAVKVFKPKFPLLEDYSVIRDAEFWDVFPVNYTAPAKSNIDSGKLRQLLIVNGIELTEVHEKVLGWLQHGAEIGCEGRYRAASVSKNTKGAYACGREVSDAIASWVKQGYAFGPVEEEEVPVSAKVNSILTRPKPNGSVRIILNLSAPKGLSVNDGIDPEEFPAVMSSTEAWLRVLEKAGRGCFMCKVDFADAYKHVAVALEDTDLQWFEWGGKFFKELWGAVQCRHFGRHGEGCAAVGVQGGWVSAQHGVSAPRRYVRRRRRILQHCTHLMKFLVMSRGKLGSSWRTDQIRIRRLVPARAALFWECSMTRWRGRGQYRRTSWSG
jgi:hypothetical protein